MLSKKISNFTAESLDRMLVRPSIRVLGLQLIGLMLTFSLTGHTLVKVAPNYGIEIIRTIATLVCLCCAELVRRYFNELYIFNTERIIHLSGRISFHFKVVSIRYEDIREISVSQSILGRLLNFGVVKFSTASQDKHELICGLVDLPKLLADYSDGMRHAQPASVRRHKILKLA